MNNILSSHLYFLSSDISIQKQKYTMEQKFPMLILSSILLLSLFSENNPLIHSHSPIRDEPIPICILLLIFSDPISVSSMIWSGENIQKHSRVHIK